jgi:hypothetical protein
MIIIIITIIIIIYNNYSIVDTIRHKTLVDVTRIYLHSIEGSIVALCAHSAY